MRYFLVLFNQYYSRLSKPKRIMAIQVTEVVKILRVFYCRLRGWEQRKKFLKDVNEEVNRHVRDI